MQTVAIERELLLSSKELIKETGITYRQLDYWTSKGYLEAIQSNPGCGQSRQFYVYNKRNAVVLRDLSCLGSSEVTTKAVVLFLQQNKNQELVGYLIVRGEGRLGWSRQSTDESHIRVEVFSSLRELVHQDGPCYLIPLP